MRRSAFTSIGLLALVLALPAPAAGAAAPTLVRTSRVAPPGVDPNGPSGQPSLSADARYVAFASEASNLGPSVGTRHTSNVYVFDFRTGGVQLESAGLDGAPANAASSSPSISADGAVVTFASRATNLVHGTVGHVDRIYVEVRGHPPRLISPGFGGVAPDGDCTQPVISADGHFVAFSSTADNLVAGDDNATSDVFLVDLRTGILSRISVSSSGAQARGASVNPAIDGDGGLVSFTSSASNLVSGDHNHVPDVFVHNTVTGETLRATTTPGGHEQNASVPAPFSQFSSLSGDGRYVVFDSNATNLTPLGAGAGHTQVFRKNLITGHVWLVSQSSLGATADNDSFSPTVSANGQVTVFESFAENLADPWAPVENVYAQDFSSQTALSLDVSATGTPRDQELGAQLLQRPALDADGQAVAFTSGADNLVTGDYNGTDDVFVRVITPPRTSVVKAPENSSSPKVEFAGSLPLSKQGLCELDGRRQLCPLGRPFRLPRLHHGPHVLKAYAGAPGTLFDPKGAELDFTVP